MTKNIVSITLLTALIMILTSMPLFADRLGGTKGVYINSDAGKTKSSHKAFVKFTIRNSNKHGVNVDVTLIGETNNDDCTDTTGSRKISVWLKPGESKTYTIRLNAKCEVTGLCVSFENLFVRS